MLPVIALVGRPNVGKSTLFNCLTRTRDAIVADIPGVTRDRQYGHGRVGDKPFLVIDTGGIGYLEEDIDTPMADQTQDAIGEADYIFFMVDARDGVTAADRIIADNVRRASKPVFLVINKTDGLNTETECSEFYQLGFGDIAFTAASHNRGVRDLIERCLKEIPLIEQEEPTEDGSIKVAVVGKPNVGKSTLINRMLGEERVVVFDRPGTTRDSISIPFTHNEQDYTLIDTAGVRRRAKVDDMLEKFSIIKTLQAIEQAHVVIVVLNARDGIGEQDLRLLGHVIDAGRSFLLAFNQWDGLDHKIKEAYKSEIDRRLGFTDYAEQFFISALHGTNVGHLFAAVRRAYRSAMFSLTTANLSSMLERAVMEFQPPMSRGRRIKLRFAHPAGNNPPTIKIHGTQTARLSDSYKRYLINFFRRHLKLVGTPIQLIFADSDNPFKGRRNKLTPRQEQSKKRMMRFVKRKKKSKSKK